MTIKIVKNYLVNIKHRYEHYIIIKMEKICAIFYWMTLTEV